MSGPVPDPPALEFWASYADNRATIVDTIWRVRRVGEPYSLYVDRWSPSAGWHPDPGGGSWLLKRLGTGFPDDRDPIDAATAARLIASGTLRDPLAP
jgi:hypothetical protein